MVLVAETSKIGSKDPKMPKIRQMRFLRIRDTLYNINVKCNDIGKRFMLASEELYFIE